MEKGMANKVRVIEEFRLFGFVATERGKLREKSLAFFLDHLISEFALKNLYIATWTVQDF